jgi:hypothetical protein
MNIQIKREFNMLSSLHNNYCITRTSLISIFLIFLLNDVTLTQTVKVVWDGYDSTVLSRGNVIRVRILSSESRDTRTLIFDSNRVNSSKETYGGHRRLFQQFSDEFIQTDSFLQNAVVLDQTVPKNYALFNFTTSDTASDLANFALGYGLYFIQIEIPILLCQQGTNIPKWALWRIPIDFRDSRFPYQGIINNIEIHVRIKNSIPGDCFGAHDLIDSISITVPKLIHLSKAHPTDYSNMSTMLPVFVQELFDQGDPEYNFTISNEINDDSVAVKYVFLTHPVIIKTDIHLNRLDEETLYVTSQFSSINSYASGGSTSFTINRDVIVRLDSFIDISGSSKSCVVFQGVPTSRIKIQNKNYSINSSGVPSGITFGKGSPTSIHATLDYCDLILCQPIYYRSNYSIYGTYSVRLTINHCTLKATATSDEAYYACLKSNSCIYMESVCALIENSIFTSNWDIGNEVSYPQTAIVATGVCRTTKIDTCVISGMTGFGIDMRNIVSYGNRPELTISNNQIVNNAMGGIYVSGVGTNIYIYNNNIQYNGQLSNYEISICPIFDPHYYDGINIMHGYSVIQNNQIKFNNRYGLSNFNGYPSGWDATGMRTKTTGENCFKNNWINIGTPSRVTIGEFDFGRGTEPNYRGNQNTFLFDILNQNPIRTQVYLAGNGNAIVQNNIWSNVQYRIHSLKAITFDSSSINQNNIYLGASTCIDDSVVTVDSVIIPTSDMTNLPHYELISLIDNNIIDSNWSTVKQLAIILYDTSNSILEKQIASNYLVKSAFYTMEEGGFDYSIVDYMEQKYEGNYQDSSYSFLMFALAKLYNISGDYSSAYSMLNDAIEYYIHSSDVWKAALMENIYISNFYLNDYSNAVYLLNILLSEYQFDGDVASLYYIITSKYPIWPMEKRSISRYSEMKPISAEIFPNPVSNTIEIKYELDQSERVSISIWNMTGEKVIIKNVYAKKGTNYEAINIMDISRGAYILEIKCQNLKNTIFIFNKN